MKLATPQTLAQIAEIIGCEYAGDPSFIITGINEIHRVEFGDVVFVDHPKYYEKALTSAASVVIINQKIAPPEGKCLLFSDDPFSSYNALTKHFSPWSLPLQSRGKNVSISESAHVHPSVVMGDNVSIGEGCIIHPGVVLYNNITVGDRAIIHANCVIGSDAFYYKSRPEGREKMHSVGSVIIEHDVEIGASCTIDRGVSAATIIGAYTKIDNHVHIGHDTIIGKHCLFAAHVGIAGCVILEDHVILWGQVGVTSDVRIGERAVVLGQSGVTKDIAGGKTYFGTPAEEARGKYREMAAMRKLPAAIEQLGL